MPEVPLLPKHARIVLVVLQDGRQLEGEPIGLTDRVPGRRDRVRSWEIEELRDE
ncbi:MAG TPA: hypothetical protein VIK61_07115 [Acidimicrobiia bacterium]